MLFRSQWALSQKDGLKPKFEEFNVCAMLQDVTSSLRSQAGLKQMQLINECQVSEKMVADRAMVETVVRNLVSNALKFGNEGSKVLIKVVTNNKFVEISVSNSGVGMTTEEADRLFRIDGQAQMIGNHPEKGSGFGLVLCNEFVKVHGGTISLQSHTAENTCFVCTFCQKVKHA